MPKHTHTQKKKLKMEIITNSKTFLEGYSTKKKKKKEKKRQEAQNNQ